MNTAILAVRPVVAPDIILSHHGTTHLARLFALDCLPVHRWRPTCSWHRDADGRLVCIWEPDVVPVPHR